MCECVCYTFCPTAYPKKSLLITVPVKKVQAEKVAHAVPCQNDFLEAMEIPVANQHSALHLE